MTRLAKPAVIAAFSLLWFVVSLMRVPDNIGNIGDIGIDVSWVIALPELLNQGAISGRDFHFTYGPLGQALAYAGASLHSPWSAFDSLPVVMLAFYTATVALFAALLLLLPLDWKHCVFVCVLAGALNLFSEPTAFRPVALMLGVVLFARAMEKGRNPSIAAGVGWSGAAGMACFAAQLLTFELGLFSILAIGVGGVIVGFRRKLLTRFKLCYGVVVGVYAALNVGLGLIFGFDYHRFALEMAAGFAFSQGLPWELGRVQTLGLAIACVFALAAAFEESDFFVLLLSASVIQLKSLTVRSDVGHITQSTGLLVFVFLLFGATLFSRWRKSKTGPVLWVFAFSFLWFSWPWAGNYFAAEVYRAATVRSPGAKLTEIRRVSNVPVETNSSAPLLAFPYDNYVPLLAKRRLVAPVVMSYNASTEDLQQFYVASLDREPDLEIVYGVSKAIDNVQTISRTPLIFDYIYQNFRLRGETEFGNGFYLLQRATAPRPLEATEIAMSKPAACNLLRLNLLMNYSLLRHFGRPAPAQLTFFKDENPFLTTIVPALKPNAPFFTYVSLIPVEQFQQLFGSDPIAPTSFDRIEVSNASGDWLSVSPSTDIRKVECLVAR